MNELISFPPDPIITKFAMASRFTDSEYVAILSASKTDIEVEAWYAKFMMASEINLLDYRTISGMNLLVSKGLLTEDRANTILTSSIQPNERP